ALARVPAVASFVRGSAGPPLCASPARELPAEHGEECAQRNPEIELPVVKALDHSPRQQTPVAGLAMQPKGNRGKRELECRDSVLAKHNPARIASRRDIRITELSQS